MKTQLQKALQTWFNTTKLKGGVKVNCTVKDILEDKSAVIKINPAPGAVIVLLIIKSLVSCSGDPITYLCPNLLKCLSVLIITYFVFLRPE